MPSKMAKFCREKGVLITMYEEKPRKRRVSPNQPQPHHHLNHHHHQYLHHASAGKEYNRRAELLRYSERLRESARPVDFNLSQTYPTPPNKQQPPNETIAVLIKKKNSARTPNCLGDCNISIPKFIRSLTSPKGKKERKKKKQIGSTTNKMKALMKSLQEQKKRGFIPKLFSTLRKRR